MASDDAKSCTRTITELGLHRDKASRQYKSYFRRRVFRVFGGLEWLHAVIALGQLPQDFVEIVRENCRRRQALGPAQGNRSPPRQLKRGEREEQRVVGIRHKVSEAKELREKAKLIDKRIGHEDARWERGESTMTARQWSKLLDAREAAWDLAESVSRSTGFPFKDRDGRWVNNIQRDLVGLSLCEWCRKHDLVYS